jgi:uncharacterized membrane protein YfcA
MDALDVIGLVVVGCCGGMLGGIVGVGGGVIFVPGLVIFADLSQLQAESTSLLAIVFVASVGAWRQHGYGNLRPRDALWIGLLSPLGVVAGTGIANVVSERTLELSFAAVQIYFAYNLAKRALRPKERAEA